MAVGVISEFNPFHNGHKYLFDEIKKQTDEPIIVVMSGSFTQRGEVAVTDKFTRTKTALKCGADLVLEIPCAYAVASAEKFAYAATQILSSFSCFNTLAFGCEQDNIQNLLSAANAQKNFEVQKLLSEKMNKGEYYPRAYESAVREILGDKTADVLIAANNTLAVEYIRQLEKSNVSFMPVKRFAVEHDSHIANSNYASASLIRKMLRNSEDISKYVPKNCEKIENVTDINLLDRIILYRLRTMSREDISKIPDVNEGLENRIYEISRNAKSVDELVLKVKTKRYTHARLRRIMTCVLLNITKDIQKSPIDYVRVLGFTENGAKLLKYCKKTVVTSPQNTDTLSENAKLLLKKDIMSTDIFCLAYKDIVGCGKDYYQQIIKL